MWLLSGNQLEIFAAGRGRTGTATRIHSFLAEVPDLLALGDNGWDG